MSKDSRPQHIIRGQSFGHRYTVFVDRCVVDRVYLVMRESPQGPVACAFCTPRRARKIAQALNDVADAADAVEGKGKK